VQPHVLLTSEPVAWFHLWLLDFKPTVEVRTQRLGIQARVLITVEEAAARLSFGRTQAYTLVMRGELQSDHSL
jgi:hypothetical protein